MRYRLLSVFWGILGLANVARAMLAFFLKPAFESYSLSVPLPIQGGVYLLWGVIFLAFGVLSWMQRALRWAIPLGVAYQTLLWMLHLFAYRSEYARNLWLRDAVLTAVFLLVVVALSIKGNTGRGRRRGLISRES
ncbi:MAG: hypothetical protein JXA21_07245 [Anaerolineae bacterium]|nr:hypothetical protein [Anaerolineae bacterium]